jgi:hemolysin activation/secretion protein
LESDNGVNTSEELTTLELGSFYFFDKSLPLISNRIQIETSLRFGSLADESESKFSKFKFKGNWHYGFHQQFAFNLTGHLELSSKNTPIYELPSLGPEIVRGVIRDDSIGKHIYGIQTELWTPFPISKNIDNKFNRFVDSHIRLAFFVDVAYISYTTGSEAGYRWSPGFGLRFLMNPIRINLDWAYGFVPKDSNNGGGRIFLNISTTMPF